MIETMPRRAQPPRATRALGAPTQVRLSAAQRLALGTIAGQRDVALGEVIRDAVDALLEGYVDADGRTLLEAAEEGQLDDVVWSEVEPDHGDD